MYGKYCDALLDKVRISMVTSHHPWEPLLHHCPIVVKEFYINIETAQNFVSKGPVDI